jgi:hypothetical protein
VIERRLVTPERHPDTMTDTHTPSEHAAADQPPEFARALPAVDAAPAQARRRLLADPFGLRALVITWCLWLLLSWSITLAMNATVHAVRWVIFSAVFGLMAVWPALRLSQQLPWYQPYRNKDRATPGQVITAGPVAYASSPTRVLATFLDWLCLVSVFQVVVWPLMIVGEWNVQQTLWLNLAVLSWSLLTGALIGLGRVLPTGWARMAGMSLCMLLVLGEPAWMAISGPGFAELGQHGPDWQMRISPIQALWELTTTIQPYDPAGWIPAILSAAGAAVIAWIVLGVMAVVTRD